MIELQPDLLMEVKGEHVLCRAPCIARRLSHRLAGMDLQSLRFHQQER